MNYSPGPWRVGSDGVTVILSDGQEISLASEAKDRAAANARLVAAAPELLDALKALFASYKQLADSGDSGFWHLEDQPEGQLAMVAIHKAEGQ